MKAINGTVAPGPRFTRWAFWYFMLHIVCPVMTIAILLDVAMWYLAQKSGMSCYALLCLVL